MSQPPEPHTLEKSALELSKSARAGNSDPVTLFKNFRKEEELRLRAGHDAGGGGREIARQRSDMMDILFRELFEDVVRRVATKSLAGRLAVMAFGGYGRRELTPMSDVDILFLQDKSTVDKEVEEIIRQTLVALWDIGFKVGQASLFGDRLVDHVRQDAFGRQHRRQ